MRLVFFGTPEFAAISLQKIIDRGTEVAAVVSAPDKPAGRGLKMLKSEVAQLAEQYQLKLFQPQNLKDPLFIDELKQINADLFVVVAFRKIPSEVWQIPPKGTINLHASLLPAYRGAAPIHHVIINGEQKTGITTFFINEKIDCGEIILQQEISIEERETAGSLHDKLALAGAELLCKTIDCIKNQNIQPVLQDFTRQYPLAPKINREFCRINWSKKAVEIDRFIRGLSPSPTAFTLHKNKVFKIYEAYFEISSHKFTPGSIITDHKNFLKVAVTDGFIDIKIIQAEGRKILDIKEFLRGYVFGKDDKFEQ